MLPVIFSFGSITIYSLGFLTAVGFFLAAFIIWRRLRDLGLNEEKTLDFIILAVIFSLFFSLLAHLVEKQRFSNFSLMAGLIGVGLILGWFSKKERWNWWQIADEVTFGILPLLFLVQMGFFFDGSDPGRPTSMPWGVYFPGRLFRSQPVSLFSAAALFLIWLFLLRIERQWRTWQWYKSKKNGLIVLLFLILIFSMSFVIAFWRHSGIYWYWAEIVLSFLGAISAGVILYFHSGKQRGENFAFLLRRKHGRKKSQKKKEK